MSSVVTQRFVACLKKLKEQNDVRSYRQFAISLDYLPQSLNDIIHAKRDVTIELCRKACEQYQFNLDFLFKGQGEMFTNQTNDPDQRIVTVVTDNQGQERITMVDAKAHAGYGQNMYDPIYMKSLPTFSLPDNQFSQGTFRCFGIVGDSMEPCLYSGDKLVCSFIEPDHWAHAIKDNGMYVIVTENEIVVKRVQNNIKELGEVNLISDNTNYQPYVIPVGEIKEIWCAKMKLSQSLSSPKKNEIQVQDQISALSHNIKGQSELINSLNLTIEALLKQQRSQRVR